MCPLVGLQAGAIHLPGPDRSVNALCDLGELEELNHELDGKAVRLLQVRGRPGYLPGWRQSAATLDVLLLREVSATARQKLSGAAQQIAREELPDGLQCTGVESPTIHCITNVMLTLLRHGGWPVFHRPETYRPAASPGTVRMIVPSVRSGEYVLRELTEHFLQLLTTSDELPEGADPPEAETHLQTCIELIRLHAPGGINTLRFLEAADRHRIPWMRLTGNLYQYGWGRNARWLDSSFTDATPLIASRIARDKRTTSMLLHQAGVPVPDQRSVNDENAALEVTRSFGFPVVVKPADSDGGQGVHAYLRSEEEVVEAFRAASQVSRNIVVEKHVIGSDYRIQVFQGKVYSANQRIPASVTGDGVSSVRELVDITNADPMRGPPGSPLLKWIVLDDQAHQWLQRQSLTVNSVPAAGQFVRLRGAANIASGGNIEPVLEVAHPDNLRLAERAVSLLRLDIAGVDLLMPDIRHSWRETGAAICEVNAQPQMAPELPEHVLQRMVRKHGRIPVVVVIEGKGDDGFRTLAKAIAERRSGVGAAGLSGVLISGQPAIDGATDSFQAAQYLLRDPAVQFIVLHLQDHALLRFGSPFDRIDHLVFAITQEEARETDIQAVSAQFHMLKQMADHTWVLDGARAPGANAHHRSTHLDEVLQAILENTE